METGRHFAGNDRVSVLSNGAAPPVRLDQLFADQAKLTPDRAAILYRGAEMSYRTLDGLSNQIARHLRKLGVARNTCVGVCIPRTPHLIAAMLGILKAGGGYVPLDPAYPADRLNFILADSGASLLLTKGEVPQFLEYEGCTCDLDAGWKEIEGESAEPLPPLATGSDLAYVIYTSGSTGQPKGVMLAHTAVGLVHWLKQSFDPSDIARVAAVTSISFDPSIIEIFGTLCTGGLVILKANALEPFGQGESPTMLAAPPSVLGELARAGAIPDSVRILNVGGEAVTSSLVRALYESSCVERIYNHYGPTEATTCTTVALVGQEMADDPPLGRPIAGARVYVLDSLRQPLAVGEIGEIYIAGPTLALGYLGDPDATNSRFMPDPFCSGERMYQTGDLGMFDPSGELIFKGRMDDQVKLRGFRIELGEIEAALMRLADIHQAAVFVHADDLGRERLVAFIVSDEQPSLKEVRLHLAKWLPDHMLPSQLVPVDKLPLSPSGKVDRTALAKSYIVAPPSAARPSGSMTANEQLIADVFARHLNMPALASDDDFFELGGDSLLSIQVALQLEALLGQTLPPSLLNQASTPRALSEALAAQPSQSPSILTPLHEGADGHFIFCTPDLHGRPLSYLSLARRLAPLQTLIGLSPGPLLEAVAEPSMNELSRMYFKAIRALQPVGPYIISGFSFGAVQAFSLARLIEDEGERVLLVLIDGPNPTAKRTLKHVLRWTLREMPKVVDGQGWKRTAREALRSRSWTRLLKNSKGRIRQHEIPSFVSQADRAVAKSFLQAIVDYVPEPFSGTSLLIRCSHPDRRFRLFDADGWLGWRGLHIGIVHHATVEGTHMQIMREPLVGNVQAIIERTAVEFLRAERSSDAQLGTATENAFSRVPRLQAPPRLAPTSH